MFPIPASESKEARRKYSELKKLLQSGITVEEYLMPRGYTLDYKKASQSQKTNKKPKEYYTSLPTGMAPKTYYSFNRLMENCPQGFFTEERTDPFAALVAPPDSPFRVSFN